MKKQNEIIDCRLSLPIQKLYIKRLKHMISRWEYQNFCGHCPINKRFASGSIAIKEIKGYGRTACSFCTENVDIHHCGYRCPCRVLGPKEALKRAKDFILRFELKHSKKDKAKSNVLW